MIQQTTRNVVTAFVEKHRDRHEVSNGILRISPCGNLLRFYGTMQKAGYGTNPQRIIVACWVQDDLFVRLRLDDKYHVAVDDMTLLEVANYVYSDAMSPEVLAGIRKIHQVDSFIAKTWPETRLLEVLTQGI